MNKENVLFSLVGVGFGLFFGFAFAFWANQRAAGPGAGGADAARQLPSNAVAEQSRMASEAEARIKRAREKPDDFDAQLEAGKVYYRMDRYDEAVEFLLRANQLQPDNLEAVVTLGNVNYDAGNYKAAEKWYAAALAKNPDDINVRTDLGATFVLREPPELDRAIAEFRRSLERDPRHEPTLSNLTFALTRRGDKAEAQATLKRLEEINPDHPAIPQLRAGLEAAAQIKTSGGEENGRR